MTQEATAVFCPHCEQYQTDEPAKFTGTHGENGRLVCVNCLKPFRWVAKMATVFVTHPLDQPTAGRKDGGL